jgi:hypothetical protein
LIVESYDDVIVLTGALRSNFWETIHTAISLTLRRHPTGVIIDCSGITEITEEGAETFHDAIEFVTEHERARIVVAAVPGHVLEVLRSVPEVRSQLPISDTVEAARRSLDLLVESDGEPKKKKKEPEARSYDRTIVAVLSGDDSDQELLHVTDELLSTMPAKVVLLFPIIVPRNLPLQAPMPEQEATAVKTIEMAKAHMVKTKTAHEAQVEHGRDYPSLIQEVTEKVDAERVIFAFSRRSPEKMEEGLRLVGSIMHKVTRPIVIVRGRTDGI